MIILHVTFRTHPGKAEEFVRSVLSEGIAKDSEAEAGNEYYDFYYSAENENEVMLLEKWESQDALDLHCKQAHYKRIGELKDRYVVETSIEKYELK